MKTENLTQTLCIQAIKQSRLEHEFAWLAKNDLLFF